jgi:4-hydroxy-tetrahydrodipicolinate reductase
MKWRSAFKPVQGKRSIPGVALYGLGAIGIEVARHLAQRTAYPILAAVDTDPAKVDKPLGEIIGVKSVTAPVVTPRLPGPAPKGAVALHMAGSRMPEIETHLAALINAGYAVASCAEELCYPHLKHPEMGRRVDRLARAKGVAVASVGVNPGFVMDLLPLVTCGVCQDIERVEVARVVDASTRRATLQRKIGCGLTPEQFRRLAVEGKVGHVGLAESCAFLADGLGLDADEIEESLTPAIARRPIRTQYLRVEAGQVCGIHQTACAKKGEKVRVSLDLQLVLGAEASRDEIHVVGTPEVRLLIFGGTQGDFATVAALVNAIPRVAAAAPGLRTMAELPFVR